VSIWGSVRSRTLLTLQHYGPRMAFIIDIRRQNMIEHLLYKAFMELASDPRPVSSACFSPGRGRQALAAGRRRGALFGAFDRSNPSSILFDENLRRALDHLEDRGITLSFGDQTSMRKVYKRVLRIRTGPQLYICGKRSNPRPGYAQLFRTDDRNGRK